MFKKTKIALSLVLVLAMFAGLLSAVAFTPPAGTPADPAEAGISKVLVTPEGTTIPADMAFNFTVTPRTLNGYDPGSPELEIPGAPGTFITMPALGNTLGAGVGPNHVRIPADTAHTTDTTTAGNVTTRVFESGDLLDGITWPAAGIYVYRINEVHNVLPHVINLDDDILEAVYYSDGVWDLVLHVFEGVIQVSGVDTVVLYVRYAYAVRITNDDGTPGTGKTDPTPGDSNTIGDWSQMTFRNRYTRTYEQDTEEYEGPLYVRKVVTGNAGSTTRLFDFSITLTLNVTDFPSPTAFTAQIFNAANQPLPTTDARFPGVVTMTRGANNAVTATFQLRHGERLVFQNTPAGTHFSTTETAVALYDTTVSVNGATAVEALTATGLVVANPAANTVVYTNDNEFLPPTGVDVGDLPFIGMIVLALGGLVTFVIITARKRRSYYY